MSLLAEPALQWFFRVYEAVGKVQGIPAPDCGKCNGGTANHS